MATVAEWDDFDIWDEKRDVAYSYDVDFRCECGKIVYLSAMSIWSKCACGRQYELVIDWKVRKRRES